MSPLQSNPGAQYRCTNLPSALPASRQSRRLHNRVVKQGHQHGEQRLLPLGKHACLIFEQQMALFIRLLDLLILLSANQFIFTIAPLISVIPLLLMLVLPLPSALNVPSAFIETCGAEIEIDEAALMVRSFVDSMEIPLLSMVILLPSASCTVILFSSSLSSKILLPGVSM